MMRGDGFIDGEFRPVNIDFLAFPGAHANAAKVKKDAAILKALIAMTS